MKTLRIKLVRVFKLVVTEILVGFLIKKTERTENEIMLSPETYVEKLLENFNTSESKPLETPLENSLKLSNLGSPEIGSNEHREMQSCDYRGIV